MADDLLEKEVHRKLREYAYKTYGEYDHHKNVGLVKVIKLTTLAQYGEAGIMDHLWLVKGGRVFFIELKREKGICTDIQIERQNQVRGMGFPVFVAPGLTRAKQILDQAVRAALGKKWRPGTETP